MLNRIPSPSPNVQQQQQGGGGGGPAVTSVRVRATSTQTERPSTLLLNHPTMSSPVLLQSVKQSQLHHFSQGTQTTLTVAELLSEDNNNKIVGGGGGGGVGRALPRVVDASPKPQKLVSKLVDLAQSNGKVNGSGSWGDPDEERPSVEGGRRSYSSRIPTPIKPTVIPITTMMAVTPTGSSPTAALNVNNNYNNNNKTMSSSVVAAPAVTTTPSKRELPDIPVTNVVKKSPPGLALPLTPQQLGSKLHHHHHVQRGSKSDPTNVPPTTKVLPPPTSSTSTSTSSAEMQQLLLQQHQQQQQSNVLLHHPHHNSNHPRPIKSSFWGAWWKL